MSAPGSPELTREEFEATFSPPMRDITAIAEALVPLWDYLDPVIEARYDEHPGWQWRVTHIYESGDGRYQHINLPAPRDNTYLSVVVEKTPARIVGHYLLDLGALYGL